MIKRLRFWWTRRRRAVQLRLIRREMALLGASLEGLVDEEIQEGLRQLTELIRGFGVGMEEAAAGLRQWAEDSGPVHEELQRLRAEEEEKI